jgi:hypothetical protein
MVQMTMEKVQFDGGEVLRKVEKKCVAAEP